MKTKIRYTRGVGWEEKSRRVDVMVDDWGRIVVGLERGGGRDEYEFQGVLEMRVVIRPGERGVEIEIETADENERQG